MKVHRVKESSYLIRKYETLKIIWHDKINYLRMYEDNKLSFIQKAWLRLYIMNIKREMEDILFRLGRLRKYTACDDCGRLFDEDI